MIMGWLSLATAFIFSVSLSVGQETCQVPVTCENTDGSTIVKTVVLPTFKDIRAWRLEGAKAKKERERAQQQGGRSSTSHCDEPGWLTGQGGECQYKVIEATMTWEDARKFCMQKGADLAYRCITQGDNFRYLTDRIKGKNMRGFWIGMSDRAKEGDWKWLDGTSAKNAKWGNNQPDDKDGDQDCGWISPGMGYNVDDGDCTAQFFPLCERLI